jgi:hypothetical protein
VVFETSGFAGNIAVFTGVECIKTRSFLRVYGQFYLRLTLLFGVLVKNSHVVIIWPGRTTLQRGGKMYLMNDEQFDDLKQFIDSRASQTEAILGQRIDALEKKVDDGFAGAAEPIDQINNRIDELDHRLTRLEQQAA